MPRFLTISFALASALSAAACHSGSTSGGSDASVDACPPCVEADDAGRMVSIACGQNGCAEGIAIYCSKVGDPIIYNNCAAVVSDAKACTPTCLENSCNVDDGCGGTCQCAGGLPCDSNNRCGNGCSQVVGAYCILGDAGSNPYSCCAYGGECRDGAPPSCCALPGGGECQFDSDCCDTSAHCLPIQKGLSDAGDASVVVGYRCE